MRKITRRVLPSGNNSAKFDKPKERETYDGKCSKERTYVL